MGNKSLYNLIPSKQFGIGGDKVSTKQLAIDTNDQAPNTKVTLKGNASTVTDLNISFPSSSGTLALDTGAVNDSFRTIQCPLGTSPVADSNDDTLTLQSDSGTIDITGDSSADSVSFDVKWLSPTTRVEEDLDIGSHLEGYRGYTLLVNATSAAADLRITLPGAADARDGYYIHIKDTSGDMSNYRFYLRSASGDIENNHNDHFFYTEYGSWTVTSDGNAWWIT